jgi:hypothetical protein
MVGGAWYIIYVAGQAEYFLLVQQGLVTTHAQPRIYQMAQAFDDLLQHD